MATADGGPDEIQTTANLAPWYTQPADPYWAPWYSLPLSAWDQAPNNWAASRGLFGKYHIEKADGSPIDPRAVYFVLRIDTDEAARLALWLYAHHCQNEQLARDLIGMLKPYGLESCPVCRGDDFIAESPCPVCGGK